MRSRRFVMPGAVALLTAVTLATAAPRESESRSLIDLSGTVSTVLRTPDDGGHTWIDAVVADGSRGAVRIRLAPEDALERLGFTLAQGDAVRARVFADETPHGVHRIWNDTAGGSIRLRCLHGDPLWDADHPGGKRWRGGRERF